MTGNTIKCLDSSLSKGNYKDVAILASVIVCYVLGGVIFDQLSLLSRWRIRNGTKGKGGGSTANMMPFSRNIIDMDMDMDMNMNMNMDGNINGGNDEHEHDGQAKDKDKDKDKD
eukprot:CAMPEP_0194126778 /NCGR_PEP_ID=MMETSP0150-20130528/60169_1 /TAXON_ID=122233 /ORGANISM="Chaetoceros debilis, Strain MM31A-1" /LENGTH=113 /DNA_ID=CAMNT_0038820659 /DNA_START=754 /DNA_END=1092 /DNA_ORIENTATION=+